MPKFEATLSDGSVVELEADHQPTEEEVHAALKNYQGPPAQETTTATGAFGRGLATGIAPSAAFVGGFEAVAPPVTGLALETGPWAPVIGGAAGLLAGTGAAALTAYGQGKLLKAVAPGLAAKLEAKQRADVAQHPVASMAGELAAMVPSAELAIPKLAQIPFRAGLGGVIAGVQPVVTEGRAPTARDIAGGAIAGTIFGRSRLSGLLPRTRAAAQAAIQEGAPSATQERIVQEGRQPEYPRTGQVGPTAEAGGGYRPKPAAGLEEKAQVPLSPEDQAHIDAERGTVDVPVEVVADVQEPGQPFALSRTGQFMGINRAKGTIEIYPQEFSRWLNQDVPPERRALAVRSRLAEERNHLAVTPEQALSYWDTLTPLEKLIEQRTYQGPGRWAMRPDISPTDMGFEAIRARFQRYARMSRSEIAESALKERIKLQTLQALEDTVRGVRESLGTSASREGLAILNHVDDGIQAAKAALAGKEPAALRRLTEVPEDAPAFAQAFRGVPILEAPDFATPELAAKLKRSIDVAKTVDPAVKTTDVTAEWKALTAQQRQELARRGWSVTTSRTPGQLLIGPTRDALSTLRYMGQAGPAAIRRGKEAPQPEFFLPPVEKGVPLEREVFAAAPDYKMVQQSAKDFVAVSKAGGKEPVFEDFAGPLRAKYGANVREEALHNAWYDALGKEPPETLKKEWKRSAVWPEDVAQEYVVTEPSKPLATRASEEGAGIRGEVQDFTQPTVETSEKFRRLNVAEATPEWVGAFIKKGGRTFKAPVSVSKNLVAFRNQDGRVALVSGYQDPRRGAVVTNPQSATGPARVVDADLLRGTTPIAAMSLREPVQHFRQTFPSEEAFWKHFGDLGAQEAPAGVEPAEPTTALPVKQPISRPAPVPEPISETARELTTPGRTRPIPAGSPLYRSPRPSPIPAELLPPEAQRAVAAQSLAKFPTSQAVPEPGVREVLPGLAEPTGRIGTVGAPAKMGPGWPLRAGIEGTVVGRRTPAALRRFPQSAKDEISAIGEQLKSMVQVHDVVQKESALLDSVDATKNNIARQLETRIRYASAPGKVTKLEALTGQVRGNKQVLAAANAVVEAGFDRTKIREFKFKVADGIHKAQALTQSNVWWERRKGRSWLRAANELNAELDYAAAHWDDRTLQDTATKMVRALDNQYLLEKANGFDITKDENYLPHRYDAELWTGNSVIFKEQRVWGRKFRMAKTFDTHYDAIAEDAYIPITRDGASLVSHRVRQGMGLIEFDKWKEALKGVSLPSGDKLAMEAESTPQGWRAPNPRYELVSLGASRVPIAVHAEYAKPIANLLSPSYIEQWGPSRNLLHLTQQIKHTLLIGDFFHLARVLYYGASLMGPRIGWKGGWSALDIAERDVAEAVRKGVVNPKDAAWAAEQIPYGAATITRRQLIQKAYSQMGANLGKIQDALYKDLITDLTPSAGPLRRAIVRASDPTIGRYNRFLFDGLTRGLMSESIVRQFEKQQAAHPRANPDALLADISRDVNNFFGNIGRQGVFKSKSAQDMARMFFLAPQWVEGLIRKEASTYARVAGAPIRGVTGQRAGLAPLGATASGVGAGVLFMVGLTQAINLMSRGKPTWENEEKEHKFDAWVPNIGASKEGFWFSPLAVYMELTHDLYRIIEAKPKVIDAFDQIVANKESPLSRAAMVLLTGKTPTGELTTTSAGQVGEAAKALVPMPITFGKYAQAAGHAIAPSTIPAPAPGAMQRQLVATAGLKMEPAQTEPVKMARLARDFMVKNGLTKDAGWQQVQTDEPSYSKMRQALRADDPQKAEKILTELRKTHNDAEIVESMRNYARRGFTGSRKNERLFLASLDDAGLEAYSRATDQKFGELEKFLSFYAGLP